MKKPTVTVLDDYQGVARALADWSAVDARFTVDIVRHHLPTEDEIVERLVESVVVVAMRERTPFPGSLLRRLPNLRLLVTTGMANASIDLVAASDAAITVSGTGGKGNSMPELTMGMIIALTRNFAQEDANMRAGGWQHTIGPGLAGRTLGVVGLGRLGTPVAKLAQAFAMSVTAWSPHLTAQRAEPLGVRAVDKEELFGGADIITVHLPLIDATRNLIGADDLARMKPTAYLINTSRGPIVNEAALIEALRDERIAGAGLDVYDHEPLPVDHPLRSLPRTLLLPHIGYVTTENYEVFYQEAIEDIIAWTRGTPVRTITLPG